MLRLSVARALCPLGAVAVVGFARYSGNQPKSKSFVVLNVAHCEPKQDISDRKTTLKDGKVLEGQFMSGFLWGKPRLLVFPWGRYEGDVRNDLPHGYGRKIYNNGELMEGYFYEGKASGQGMHIDSDGFMREGVFVDDQLVSGKVTSSDGFVLEGTYTEGLLNGQGRAYDPEGFEYVGMFVNGAFHGRGQIKNSSGNVIDGNFVNGVLHGRTHEVDPDGSVYQAEYIHGTLQPAFTHTSTSGEVVIGTWAFLPTSAIPPHKHRLQGGLLPVEAVWYGPCQVTYPDGTVATGLMKFSAPYGKWKAIHPDGSVTVEDYTPGLADRVILWEKELRLIHWPQVKAALNYGKSG